MSLITSCPYVLKNRPLLSRLRSFEYVFQLIVYDVDWICIIYLICVRAQTKIVLKLVYFQLFICSFYYCKTHIRDYSKIYLVQSTVHCISQVLVANPFSLRLSSVPKSDFTRVMNLTKEDAEENKDDPNSAPSTPTPHPTHIFKVDNRYWEKAFMTYIIPLSPCIPFINRTSTAK